MNYRIIGFSFKGLFEHHLIFRKKETNKGIFSIFGMYSTICLKKKVA